MHGQVDDSRAKADSTVQDPLEQFIGQVLHHNPVVPDRCLV